MNRRRPLALAVVLALTTGLLLVAPSVGGAAMTGLWGTPLDLSQSGSDATQPQVQIAADGRRAIAVWVRGGVIQARVATVSGDTATWGATVDLAAGGSAPAVAISANGSRATVVWASGPAVRSRSATLNGTSATWGGVTDISAGGPVAGTAPQVALAADGGRATAVWVESDGADDRIRSASASVTGSTANWGTDQDVSAPGFPAAKPHVRVSAAGTTVVAAWQRDTGDQMVEAAVATVSGTTATWAGAATLSDAGRDAADPDVSLSDDGATATVAWVRGNGANDTAQSRSATISGSAADWGPMTELSAPGASATGVRVAASSAGDRAVAVWVRGTALQSRVGSISGNTATWGSPATLSGSGATAPQVRMSGDGSRTIAVWAQSAASVQAAAAEVSGTSGTWQSPVVVSPSGGSPTIPGVGLSADGITAVAAWTRSDGANTIVQANSGRLVGTAPTVTSVSPASGGTAGGTSITVAGSGFVTGAEVSLAGTPCTSPTVVSQSTITCSTPAHAVGSVTVTVTNPDTSTGSRANAFTYTDGPQPSPTNPDPTPTAEPTTTPGPPLISKPGVVNRLKAGNFRNGKVTISWRRPVATGSSAIVKYRIRWTKPNRKTNFRAWHEQTKTKRTLTGMKARAKYNVQVQAANAAGYGSWMTLGFRQKK